MAVIKRNRRCTLCYSPFRGDIEFLIKKGIPKIEIARKYAKEFNNTEARFYNKLTAHTERKHAPLLTDDPKAPVELPRVENFDDYAKSLLRVGLSEEMLNPRKVSHSQVIAARRTQLEERKVEGMENAQKLMIMKFFRGRIEDGPKLPGTTDIETDTD